MNNSVYLSHEKPAMSYLVISSSLKGQSRSRAMARVAEDAIRRQAPAVQLLDLTEIDLPFCDAEACYADPKVRECNQLVEQASGIIVACPIYNYSVNAVLKNFIELTGQQWREKVIGFLCAAGGEGSYMSIMGLANSLMLDFRCLILPKFVYATGEAFRGDELTDEDVQARIDELAATLITITTALESSKTS